MNRIASLSTCTLCLALFAGCNRAADEQTKADRARAEADSKIRDANRELDRKVQSAQADQEREVAAANANFQKMREDYRHETTIRLVELNKQIADLEAKSKTATGKTKADLDARLPEIRAQREAFMSAYRNVESASAATWDDTKKQLDRQWSELKSAVDKAS